MSQSIKSFSKSFKSTGDLSAKQNYIVKADVSNDQSVVIAAAATDPIVGVLENKPTAGQAALVQILGTAKVIAGGTVTRGDVVTSDSAGKAITTTTDKDVAVGRALESAVAGDIFEILLMGGTPQSK